MCKETKDLVRAVAKQSSYILPISESAYHVHAKRQRVSYFVMS